MIMVHGFLAPSLSLSMVKSLGQVIMKGKTFVVVVCTIEEELIAKSNYLL